MLRRCTEEFDHNICNWKRDLIPPIHLLYFTVIYSDFVRYCPLYAKWNQKMDLWPVCMNLAQAFDIEMVITSCNSEITYFSLRLEMTY